MVTAVLFGEIYLHIDGSTGAQPPRMQLVVYVTLIDFPFHEFSEKIL